MIPRCLRVPALLLFAATLGGCIDSGRNKVRGTSDISDDFDQQEWANTSPVGDGSGESGAYFGAPGPTSDPSPERRAASPQPKAGSAAARSPASPRLGSD